MGAGLLSRHHTAATLADLSILARADIADYAALCPGLDWRAVRKLRFHPPDELGKRRLAEIEMYDPLPTLRFCSTRVGASDPASLPPRASTSACNLATGVWEAPRVLHQGRTLRIRGRERLQVELLRDTRRAAEHYPPTRCALWRSAATEPRVVSPCHPRALPMWG